MATTLTDCTAYNKSMTSEQELPDYYLPGATLSLNLGPTGVQLSVRVIRALTPFTMSQAILVEHGGRNDIADSTALSQLPETFLAKVYDPRFYSHRLPVRRTQARPWSLEAESEAAAARRSRGMCRDPYFKRSRFPEPEDLPGWEEWYFQNSEDQFHAEAAAYDLLQKFQGSVIPRHYCTGSLHLSDRSISPHVLLLEYLPDAKSLSLVDREVVPLSLLQPLLDAVDEFGSLGVVHTDLNPGNILFSPGYQPTRAVIIDFGEAGVREEESNLKWAEIVEECDDSTWIRKRLRRALAIDPSIFHHFADTPTTVEKPVV